MPQLEQTDTYIGQLFWLIVTFGALYWVLAKAALPRIAQVLADRKRAIEQDLEKAEKLRTDATAALAGYTEAQTTARRTAQDELRRTSEAAAAKASAEQAKLAARLAEEVRAAETRIADAQRRSESQVRSLAGELVASVAVRIAGAKLAAADIDQAVGAVLAERR